MGEPQTWRELLGEIIKDERERQRITDELGINTMTLIRWVNRETDPRPQNLHKLLLALPRYHDILPGLLEAEFKELAGTMRAGSLENTSGDISAGFYSRLLRTLATVPAALRFSSLCDLILLQALKQLDPHRLGIAIIVARCSPPSQEGKIRTLRTSLGRGTPPWEYNLESQATLLGAESLTGYAVIVGHLVVRQQLREEGRSLHPAYRAIWEESAAVTPIAREGRIAGSLLVSSTQPEYFPPFREELVQSYADMIALAFTSEEFYAPECFDLHLAPPQAVQRAYLSTFRERLMETMAQGVKDQQPLTVIEAEQLVWQQVEDELLRLPLSQPLRLIP